MRLNLNEHVRATLTQRGADIWNTNEGRYEGVSYTTPKYKQVGDVVKESLWHLFEVFGEYIHLGCDMPFEGCVITIGENV